MSLGTGALKVGREPERLRHSKEVSMATLRAGTTQNTQLSKVLGERRNPRTGGGQGTSELPQQPQAPRNLKGEPQPQCKTYLAGTKDPPLVFFMWRGRRTNYVSFWERDARASASVLMYNW